MARQFIAKHQELQVYELAFEMAVRVFEISRDFPEDERARFAQPMVEASRLVAVKISEDKGLEPQTLSQLDHNYIVRVYDVAATNDVTDCGAL